MNDCYSKENSIGNLQYVLKFREILYQETTCETLAYAKPSPYS